jgi:hypothetical protein
MGGGLLLLIAAVAPAAQAQSAESKFHRAYFLEHSRGDLAAAADIYNEVAADRRADADLKAQARARGQACQEELASADFAKLMPPNALAYVELSRPGGQLSRLLEMLGLLRADGSIVGDPERRLAISPELIRELLGIRGVAAAVTGFDPATETPMGVAVLHPGDIGVIRGLIETALPAGGQIVEPIEGFPTFNIEGEVFVTLTQRLLIVSAQRMEIEGVIGRLKGEDTESLADNADLAEIMANRDPSLLFFCVNFEPVMPLLNAGMAAAGTQCRELTMAQALLDLKSLRTLVGQMGVNDEGIYVDFALQLAKGHRNLAFQFVRMPAIDPETLKRVPAGAAFFVAGALNDPDSQYAAAHTGAPGEPPPVTFLDIGREIFANIVSFAVFAVPAEGQVVAGDIPIPPVAAVITVHDPVKSQALWSQMLGIGSLASGAGTLEGMKTKIAGVEALRYVFPDGISIYLANAGNDMIISPSKAAIASSLATIKGGQSILQDPTFAKSLERLGANVTFAAYAHPGRCVEIAKPFMSPSDLAEAQPVIDLMTDTVASVVMEHSNETFRFSTMVTGLPDVGPFVSKLITMEQQASGSQHVWQQFKALAVNQQDREAALAVAEQLFEQLHDDANRLNNYAWALLTEEDKYGDDYVDVALKFSQRSNELTGHGHWAYVDTLALAFFKTGDAAQAIELEKKALALCGDGPERKEVEAALERFQAATKQ